MVKGVGVCVSYVLVYKLFFDLFGLDSIVVIGVFSGVFYVWNKVKIGNEWFYVDVMNNLINFGIFYFLYNVNDEMVVS